MSKKGKHPTPAEEVDVVDVDVSPEEAVDVEDIDVDAVAVEEADTPEEEIGEGDFLIGDDAGEGAVIADELPPLEADDAVEEAPTEEVVFEEPMEAVIADEAEADVVDEPQEEAAEPVAEVAEVAEAVEEVEAPVEEVVEETPAEAVEEVEALEIGDIPEGIEGEAEPAPAEEAVTEEDFLLETPEVVVAPVGVEVADGEEKGEIVVEDRMEDVGGVDVPGEGAPAEAPVAPVAPAPAVVAPDYNTRLMRRERSGYAGSFRLADGEQVLSMYRALSGKGLGGRVYLTNERFLIESSLHTELPITKVAGISTGKYSRLRVFKFLFGLIFIVVCVAAVLLALPTVLDKMGLGNFAATMSGVYEDMGWIRYVLFVVGGIFGLVGLIMACTSGVHRFVLTVFTEGVEQAFSVRSGVNKGDVNVYQPIAFGSPGRDYKAFISQVGSRLIEIKRAKGGK